jgi:hypothetical protein
MRNGERDRRQGEGRPEDLTPTFPMRTVDGDRLGDVIISIIERVCVKADDNNAGS